MARLLSMSSFRSYVPTKSYKLLQCWINELKVEIKISNPRKTKLGDFKVRKEKMYITINNDLNKYSFLITLVHEIAHAFVFKKHKNQVKPHARSWKLTFKSLMINFLTPDYFPDKILKVLSNHMINPYASTFSDLRLVAVLREYDICQSFTISDLTIGEQFRIANGKVFLKGEKIRKRFRCVEIESNKIYFFHPFAEVIRPD